MEGERLRIAVHLRSRATRRARDIARVFDVAGAHWPRAHRTEFPIALRAYELDTDREAHTARVRASRPAFGFDDLRSTTREPREIGTHARDGFAKPPLHARDDRG